MSLVNVARKEDGKFVTMAKTLVRVRMDRMGYVIVTLARCSDRREHRKQSNDPTLVDDGVYLQSEAEITSFFEDFTTNQLKRYRKDIENGWSTNLYLPADVVWCMFGCEL